MCECVSIKGGGRCFLHHLIFFFDHFFTHSAQFLISRQYFLAAFLAEGRLWLLSVFSGLLLDRLSAGVLLSNEIFMETPSFMPYLCLCSCDIQHKASLPTHYRLFHHGKIS